MLQEKTLCRSKLQRRFDRSADGDAVGPCRWSLANMVELLYRNNTIIIIIIIKLRYDGEKKVTKYNNNKYNNKCSKERRKNV